MSTPALASTLLYDVALIVVMVSALVWHELRESRRSRLSLLEPVGKPRRLQLPR